MGRTRIHRDEQAEAEVGGMAQGDRAGDGFWKGEAKGTAEAAATVVIAFLAKSLEF